MSAVDTTMVQLDGELDIARKQELRLALAIAPATSAILLDLSNVTYADSTALTELLAFKREADRRNVAVAIVVATPQFERIIQYAGLHEVFAVFDRREAALEQLVRMRHGQ